MYNLLVVQPAKKVSKHFGSTSMNNDWIVDRAFLHAIHQNAKMPFTVKEHFAKKIRMRSQSRCIDLESLTLYLKKKKKILVYDALLSTR